MSKLQEPRAFSAPGKALLVGGYLVLDPNYRSYVVALSARMHAVIKMSNMEKKDHFEVEVSSSQFNNDRWFYSLETNDGYKPIEQNKKRNPFIEMVLFNIFNYFEPHEGKKILIETFSDSGYHSQSDSVVKKNTYKEFYYHANSITEVPKTGLGSSAALVTVITTGLISVFKSEFNVQNNKDLLLVHGLAQVAHCQAQGKIGSGFDIAAATFGSIVYRRFAPEIISNLPDLSDITYAVCLRSMINDTDWKIAHDRIRLPDGLRLVMGDVNNGSETTKLVSKVRAWYSSNPSRASKVYENINKNNEEVMAALIELDVLSSKEPTAYHKLLESLNNKEEDVVSQSIEFKRLRDAIKEIRSNFRQITEESGADIEPPVQTTLLNSCSELKGVLAGLVPGAGGYDAIALIATENSNLQEQTKDQRGFEAVTWLALHQEDVGIQQENPLYYKNLQ